VASVEGRVIAITGAARGIGCAAAAELARRGARVAIGDLRTSDVEEAAATVGDGAIGVELDVTDRGSFARFLDTTEERLGPLDVLVNNAGVMVVGAFEETDERVAERVIGVNFGGVLTGMRLAIPRLRSGGQIVNVVSGSAWVPPPALSIYTASKHAVKGLTDSLRAELRGRGITVTAVYPNVVQTDLATGTQPARGGKWISPEEVGRAIADAVEKPRDEVFVPRSLAALLRLQAAMPPRARRALLRAFGVETLYTGVDPAAREEYERRLSGG
jgi:NAD(P)-dependent dehydrogenase (short-subunit alcohol dehydrogenase family)